MLTSFMNRKFFARSNRTNETAALRRRRATRLSLECLEDRRTPATFVLTSLADDGTVGTLRDAINQANANNQANTIIIPPSLDIGTTFVTVHTPQGDFLKEVDHNIIHLNGSALPFITSTLKIVGDDMSPDSNITRFTISGEGQSQIFLVAEGYSLTLQDVIVANGHSSTYGGAIFSAGDLDLEGAAVQDSTAANGGGIAIEVGSLTVNNSTVTGNSATATGGGISISGGSATFNSADVSSNTVTGTDNSAVSPASNPVVNSGGSAEGGGLYIKDSQVTITSTTISGNVVQGGKGGTGGDGGGGTSYSDTALEVLNGCGVGAGLGGVNGGGGGLAIGGGIAFDSGSLHIVGSSLFNNLAQGGTGGVGGAGGDGGHGEAGGNDSDNQYTINFTAAGAGGSGGAGGRGGDGGAGGSAFGGGLYVAIDPATTDVRLTNSTLANNQAIGGQGMRSGKGGDGGAGGKGGVGPTADGTSYSNVGGVGGAGGNGGTTGVPGHGGGGGVYFADPTTEGVTISSTIAYNDVSRGPDAVDVQMPDPAFPPNSGRTIIIPARGPGGKGGKAGASGAGQTLTNYNGTPGTAGAFGVPLTSTGGGIGYGGSGATYSQVLLNSIVAANTQDSTNASDIAGTFTVPTISLSNLVGTGGAGGLINGQSGNQVGVSDPGLRHLGDYGGPTETIGLLDTSPAIDAGNTGFAQALLTTDQRGMGFPRIVGGGVDIGAYESGASLVVTTLVDEDNGTADPIFGSGTSLREAINFAETKSTPQTITFAPGLTGTITLTLGTLWISKSMVINGPGANLLSISGNNRSLVFAVVNGGTSLSDVTIAGLSIINGNNTGFSGGGIYSLANLNLVSVYVAHNTAQGGGGVFSENATLNVVNSSFAFNTSDIGGGIRNLLGNANIANSTFTANTAHSDGGAITSSGALNVTNCTIASNVSNTYSGIFSENFILANSIVTDSSADPRISEGVNIVYGPGLGELQDNGGPTPTMALLPGSPALDAGNDSYALDPTGNPLLTDQRGYERISGAAVDVGAYEVQQMDVAPSTLPTSGSPWGEPYTPETFTATQGGYEPSWGPITFAVTAGALPSGMSLSSDGVLSGTPMPNPAGTFDFTITASDSAGFGSQEYSLTINQPPPIYVSPTNLARLTAGIPSSQTISATQYGYTQSWGAFDFAVTAGTLPTGLSLSTSGVLSGAPTAAGTYSFTVTASNLSGSGSEGYTLTVDPTPPPVVDTLDDSFDGDFSSGHLSLREAIAIVQSAGVDSPVTFAPFLQGTIDLSLGPIAVFGNVDIQGPGGGAITIDAQGGTQIFNVNDGNEVSYSNVSISGLKLTGSSDAAIWSSENLTLSDVVVDGNTGSGVVNDAGDISVTDSTISNNGDSGIVNMGVGPATVTDSTISNNFTTGNGGGISNLYSGQLTLINTTISGNSATNGGGIFSEGFVESPYLPNNPYPSAQLTLENVTVAGNSATLGAGVYNHWSSGLTLDNTIIADNNGPQVTDDDGGLSAYGTGYAATIAVQGSNLVEGGLQGFSQVLSDDPNLGPLHDNGGPTQTMALLPSSPAINAGDNASIPAGVTTDQRGFSRISGGAVDLGAYEVQQTTLDPATLADGTYGANYRQTITATEQGYQGPFTFTVTGGTLPSGLNLSTGGSLAGTPTAAGTFTFTVTAGHDGGIAGSQSYTVKIAQSALHVTADPQSKVYGAADPALTYTIATGDLKNGDTAPSVLSGSLTRVAGETVSGGPYAISQGTLAANGNYILAFTGNSLTVTPATPIFSNITPSQTIVAGTASIVLSGNIATSLGVIPPGNVTITINGAATSASISANGSFTASFNTTSIAASAQPYSISYAYSASGNSTSNFNDATSSTTSLTVVSRPFSIITAYSTTVFTGLNTGVINLVDFQDTNANSIPTTYTATLDWGDRNIDTKVAVAHSSADGSTVHVLGAHTYTVSGNYHPIITLYDASGASFTTTIGNTATVYAGKDVSSQISITRSGYLWNRTTGLFVSTMTINNIGGTALTGNLDVVLTNLTAGVTLTNATGTTGGGKDPWIRVSTSGIAAGQSLKYQLSFADPAGTTIGFNTRVYSA